MATATKSKLAPEQADAALLAQRTRAAIEDLPERRVAQAQSAELIAAMKRASAEATARDLAGDALLRALRQFAKEHAPEIVDDRVTQAIAARRQRMERLDQERREQERREREQQATYADLRGTKLAEAANALLNPRQGGLAIVRELLNVAGTRGSLPWRERLADAQFLLEQGQLSELAELLAGELGKTPAPWL